MNKNSSNTTNTPETSDSNSKPQSDILSQIIENKYILISNNDFKVAFIGLPSSGKSTIINSLIGKKLLES